MVSIVTRIFVSHVYFYKVLDIKPKGYDIINTMNKKLLDYFFRFIPVIKTIFFAILVIIALSLSVAIVGVGGNWVISNVASWLAWTASFAVGSLIFVIWKSISMRLKKTDLIKSEFITIAAHRIRTPLTRVQWMLSEIASESRLGKENQLIVSLEETMIDLTKASNNLLNAAEAGKSSLYYDYMFEKGQLENLVRQVVSEYSAGAKQKDINISLEIEENLPELSLDKERMKTAIGIFIENAILYTAQSGAIIINISFKNNKIIFSIKDSGIGIPKEALSYIFSKFFRTKEAVSLDRDRAGLGLFIAKEIIKRHHGSVHVESRGKDLGSHFWFSIPVK